MDTNSNVSLSGLLELFGAMIFVFAFLPKLFSLKTSLIPPREKAEKYAREHDKNPLKLELRGGIESSKLMDFRYWLSGNSGSQFSKFSSIGEIDDKTLSSIPEFEEPARRLIHEEVRALIILFIISACLFATGHIIGQ